MKPEVTVAIAAHPPRVANGMLQRALASVWAQTLPAAAVSVAVDHDREGAWTTRQRALDAVHTEWVAFLDDDDELMPHHLQLLTEAADESGADYTYGYFMVKDPQGNERPDIDPLGHFGRPFDTAAPHQTTIAVLVRTDLAKQVGFHQPGEADQIDGQRYGEDFAFTVGCCAAGAKVLHVPTRTFWWHHHGLNTSGLPTRW